MRVDCLSWLRILGSWFPLRRVFIDTIRGVQLSVSQPTPYVTADAGDLDVDSSRFIELVFRGLLEQSDERRLGRCSQGRGLFAKDAMDGGA